MKLNFLCTHHQNWLLLNPSAALATCIRAYEDGIEFAEEGNYPMAVNHAGCALEAAIVLMRVDSGSSGSNLVFLCKAGELLVRTLFELRERAQALNIYDGVLLYIESALVQDAQRNDALLVSSDWLDLRVELGLTTQTQSRSVEGRSIRLH